MRYVSVNDVRVSPVTLVEPPSIGAFDMPLDWNMDEPTHKLLYDACVSQNPIWMKYGDREIQVRITKITKECNWAPQPGFPSTCKNPVTVSVEPIA